MDNAGRGIASGAIVGTNEVSHQKKTDELRLIEIELGHRYKANAAETSRCCVATVFN